MTRSDDNLLPAIDGPGADFWTSGAHGELRIGWCAACSLYLHPARELCTNCQSTELSSRAIDGAASVVSFTENHQRWPHAPTPPYVLAIVALRAAPHVRLTTRLVKLDGRSPQVGMQLRVHFESHGDIWLPLFAPVDEAPTEIMDDPPRIPAIARAAANKFEDRVVISGVASSVIGRKLDRSGIALTIDACKAAVEDAGLHLEQIDGISAYPGTAGLPGVSSGGVRAVLQALDLHPTWHCGAAETSGQTGALVQAMLAIAGGLCRHVLVFTSFSSTQRPWDLNGGRIDGESAWRAPFGAMSPANWIALYATHYMRRYGMTRESLGWISIAARRHAARNPAALHRQPLDMDAYLSTRMISTPFGLADCDTPCDGAIAFIFSSRDAAADLRQVPVRIEAVGTRLTEPQFWDQSTLTHQVNVFGPAAHLWSRTDLQSGDVDFACLYDGFTFNAICWLEALGFCGIGEGRDFVAGAERIGPGGALPLNPHGGHLAAGRSNGYGHLQEAVLQLRGQAGERQVASAKVAVVSSGGGIPGGCLLLRRFQ